MAVIERSRLRWRDLVDEALAGLFTRPGRMVLTTLGTVLGIGALVATLGLAETAGNRIVSRFDALAATEVRVTPASQGFGGTRASTIPFDAEARLTRLNGVVAAGTRSDVDRRGALVRSVPVVDPAGLTEFDVPLVAASPGLFDAVRGGLAGGRTFDSGHDQRGDAVAVLGAGAAAKLNITRVDGRPAVFIGDEAVTVIGILGDVAREPDLLNSVIVPNGWARARFGLSAPTEVHVDTEIGAAALVGSQAALALDPVDPDRLDVRVAPEPRAVKAGVSDDVRSLFLVLGAVSLLVGALGIANVTLVSVLERTSEIGLRRAVGATRGHVAGQFVVESVGLGLLGGVLGTAAGVLVVVGYSAAQGWTPVLAGWVPLVAPALGAVVGLVAGAYPSWRAASIEPIDALRS